MQLSQRTLSIVTAGLAVTLLGGGTWWLLRPADATGAGIGPEGLQDRFAGQTSEAAIPQPVSGATVVRDTLWISVDAAGRAEAVSRAVVQAQAEGIVRAVAVRENAFVRSGDVLVRIDSTEYALGVARAESDLRRSRADYQRIVLFDDRIQDGQVRARREAIARSISGLDQAELAMLASRMRLERCRVTAPFDGRVADLDVVPGQHVSVGAALMTVVDLDPIKVEVNVLEAEMGLLAEGRRADVRFAALPGESFTGRIETQNPVLDPAARAGRVTVLLANPRGRIRPGMYAEVSIAATSFPNRLLVPRAAVLERGEGRRRTMLFVYEEEAGVGRAKWRYVSTGRENEAFVEILPSAEGTVEPGEVVLVGGHHYLAHDTPVRLVDDDRVAAGRAGR